MRCERVRSAWEHHNVSILVSLSYSQLNGFAVFFAVDFATSFMGDAVISLGIFSYRMRQRDRRDTDYPQQYLWDRVPVLFMELLYRYCISCLALMSTSGFFNGLT
jgi:hypothetical protein